MDLGSVTLVIVSGGLALVGGMAALIKGMVLSRMDRDQRAAEASRREMIEHLDKIQKNLEGLGRDMHRIDIRVTKLEAEHALSRCPREGEK